MFDRLRYSFYAAILFRILLLFFSIWQDKTKWPDGKLRFTDVDYDVFTDAALSTLKYNTNTSSLKLALENMYIKRPTYRYSPVIAILMLPGYIISSTLNESSLKDFVDSVAPLCGKLIFIICDILCGYCQYLLIKGCNITKNTRNEIVLYLITIGWLFNPITAAVSVRGSAEAFICLFVLLTLLFINRNQLFIAGLSYGFAVHLKMYPIIYALAIYLYLSTVYSAKGDSFFWCMMPKKSHFIFGVSAVISLTLTTLLSYCYAGGMLFLEKAYLYHFTRVDIKHNFSVYFYPLYLFQSYDYENAIGNKNIPRLKQIPYFNKLSGLLGLLAFLPVIILLPYYSYKFRKYPFGALFFLTYIFVTFNKVCTSQYFLWILSLAPPALSLTALWSEKDISKQTSKLIFVNVFLWLIGQSMWLNCAYKLEFIGYTGNTIWITLWLSSILFFIINAYIIRSMSKHVLSSCVSIKEKTA